ncbi:hypothetical protein [Bacillus cereus group sp. BfR-BA-01492]|uniref:hypothetical protein n=1 Tax=Bacillus cereus group sp. BfR-BA-01492 TaxID=2920361 RepID=UPI001F59C41C|nr:hypothetical protein [Bacillus cereus group sp. BfR-BA-01492]
MNGCFLILYEKTMELMDVFKTYNIECKCIVREGLGHFFPDDFPKLLAEVSQYILEPSIE